MCKTIRVPSSLKKRQANSCGSFACTNRAKSFMAALSSLVVPAEPRRIDVHDGLRHVSSRDLCAHPNHATRATWPCQRRQLTETRHHGPERHPDVAEHITTLGEAALPVGAFVARECHSLTGFADNFG